MNSPTAARSICFTTRVVAHLWSVCDSFAGGPQTQGKVCATSPAFIDVL
jgi:hypothetical protein